MDKKINWGVIGSGGIAKRRTIPEGIIPAAHANLVSVYGTNRDTNKIVAEEFNAIAVNSIGELINSGIDAVYIASPVNAHLDQVIECAKGKKHILCEKPLGLNMDEAGKMQEVVLKEGVKLGTGFMMRTLSQHQGAKQLIQDGKLGKPVYARAQLSCWYPPIDGAFRQNPETGGGGSLVDMGSHCIDLLEMLFGEVKSVSCFINNNVHDYASEDSAVVSLNFKNGAIGTVDSYFCIPDNSSKNNLELYGSKGSILAKGTLGQGDSGEMIAFLEDGNSSYSAQQERGTEEGEVINPAPVNTYEAEIEDFSLAILEDRDPAIDIKVGMRNQKVIAACYEAAKTGTVVDIK